MKTRKTCYSFKDVKIICTKCGKRFFLSESSNDYIKCPHCQQFQIVDFSEKKEWYGEYDGRMNIYDIFYCNNYSQYTKAQKDLSNIFENIVFEDASDGIHGNRFSVQLKENLNEYRNKLIASKWAMLSFNFNMFIKAQPKEARIFLEEYAKRESFKNESNL